MIGIWHDGDGWGDDGYGPPEYTRENVCTTCGCVIAEDSDYHTPHDVDCPNYDQEPDGNGLQFHVDCTCDNYTCEDCVAKAVEA